MPKLLVKSLTLAAAAAAVRNRGDEDEPEEMPDRALLEHFWFSRMRSQNYRGRHGLRSESHDTFQPRQREGSFDAGHSAKSVSVVTIYHFKEALV